MKPTPKPRTSQVPTCSPTSTSRNPRTKQTILIIGDSIPKYLNGQKMSNRFIVIKACIPGSKLELWMYIEEYMPTSVIIHCGTNNISHCYADLCVYLYKSIISNILSVDSSIRIAASSLTTQKNVAHLFWIQEFNARLRDICNMDNLTFINNDNIDHAYLARDGLHLNRSGVSLLAKNYIAFIKELCNSLQDFHLPPFHWRRN